MSIPGSKGLNGRFGIYHDDEKSVYIGLLGNVTAWTLSAENIGYIIGFSRPLIKEDMCLTSKLARAGFKGNRGIPEGNFNSFLVFGEEIK